MRIVTCLRIFEIVDVLLVMWYSLSLVTTNFLAIKSSSIPRLVFARWYWCNILDKLLRTEVRLAPKGGCYEYHSGFGFISNMFDVTVWSSRFLPTLLTVKVQTTLLNCTFLIFWLYNRGLKLKSIRETAFWQKKEHKGRIRTKVSLRAAKKWTSDDDRAAKTHQVGRLFETPARQTIPFCTLGGIELLYILC